MPSIFATLQTTESDVVKPFHFGQPQTEPPQSTLSHCTVYVLPTLKSEPCAVCPQLRLFTAIDIHEKESKTQYKLFKIC